MPKKRSFWYVAIGAFALLTMMLSACGPTTSTTNPSGPKKGGNAIVGLFEEPDTLLPFLTNETFAVMVDQAVWAPLWYGDTQGILHAGIATDVPSATNGGISPDGTTYTIHLKTGLKWSDGSPLTADDLAFSLTTYATPAFANTFGFPSLGTGAGTVASVTATDSQTVVLKLNGTNVTINALLADGASSVIPKKVFGSMSPAAIAKSQEAFKPSVTSGPFMVTDRVQGDHITLARNPNYYQGPDKPYLDQVTFKIISDQSTILAALQSGQIDSAWFLDVNKLDAYRAISGYTTHLDASPAGWEAAYFNLTNPILADPVVRQALTISFDPNTLIQQVWHGAAKPTCDPGAGTFAHFPQLAPCYTQNPQQAGTMLDSDGWTMGSDGYRHKGGKTLELRYSTTAGKAYREQTELLAQAAWKQIGVKIDIKNYPAQQFFAAGGSGILSSGNFDIGEFADTIGYDPDTHTLFESDQLPANGGSNYMHYSNAQVDSWFKQELANPDVNARKQLFLQIDQQLIKDVPLMYYYSSSNISVASNKLHNYDPSPQGPTEEWNIWDWYKA